MRKFLFAFALFLISAPCFPQKIPSPEDEQKLLRGAVGCYDEKNMKLLQKFVLQNDREAFETATGQLIYQHQCVLLEQGQDVFVDHFTADFLAEVRPKGEVQDVWVQVDAVLPRHKD